MAELDKSNDRYGTGIQLFNTGEFFEAHEVLEDVWREAPASEKQFLQGLIQVAVALHHHSQGNLVGARSVLERAARNLGAYADTHAGFNIAELLCELSEWQCYLNNGSAAPPLPRVRNSGTQI